jgi:hypothetical protein
MPKKKPKTELRVTFVAPIYDSPEQEAAAVVRANEAVLEIARLLGRVAARNWIEQEKKRSAAARAK